MNRHARSGHIYRFSPPRRVSVLSLAPAGASEIPFGILLIDSASGELEWKFREDLDELSLSPEDAEYAAFLDQDFRNRVREQGGQGFLLSLEDSLSGFLRLSQREAVSGRALPQMIDRLFDRHIGSRIVPYKTHLPWYGLRAAATKFGEDSEIAESETEWLPAPRGLRPSPDMFVVQVVGRSMEPLIPDGSLAVFRKFSVGSRQGRRLLIEELGATDSSARFTVKRYTSVKKPVSGEEWQHATIRLEPLNPDFPAFELDAEAFEGRYRVIGEFVQVLPSPED